LNAHRRLPCVRLGVTRLLAALLLCFSSLAATALPSPEQWLGHTLGELPIRPDRAAQYVEMLAERSPRVHTEVIGYSHQHRPLHLVTVTSAERLARMQTDGGLVPAEDDPVHVLLMFAVHGDELSTVAAGLLALHAIAAGDSDELAVALESSVVQLVPIANPDGYARAAAWVISHASAIPVGDPAHNEHSLGWPRGRFNHYGFDLNRQWLAASQPESQALLAAYRRWRPHLVGDFHEMLIHWPYYFSPGVAGRGNPWLPEGSREEQQHVADHLAHLLERRGELYFSAEFFDEFSPAMGSTYPNLDGAVGLLLENRGFAGRAIETDARLETLGSRIMRHRDVAIELVLRAAEDAERLRTHRSRVEQQTGQLARAAGERGYLVIDRDGGSRLRLLQTVLERHGLTVEQPRTAIRLESETVAATASLFVPLNQPGYRLVRNLFEPLTEFADPVFYDGPAWTLPPALNLESRAFRLPAGARIRVPQPTPAASPSMDGTYAWLIDWRHQYAPRALARLLRAGTQARLLSGQLSINTDQGERDYPAGVIVIPAGEGQPLDAASLAAQFAVLSAQDGVEVRATAGGQTLNGSSLGTIRGTVTRLPQVLLAWGPTLNSVEAGELWHLLDREAGVAVSLRDPADIGGLALDRYTHIVLPDGDYSSHNESLRARLETWVRAGGVLLGVRRGAQWAIKAGLVSVAASDDAGSAGQAASTVRADYADKETLEARQRTIGAILVADVDISHPLGAGISARSLPLYRSGTVVLPQPSDRFASVAAWPGSAPLAGRLGDNSGEALAGTPALIATRLGAGSVILFADNPDHRGYWHGTHRLMFNALYLARSFFPPGQRFAE
jgi:hypothetical protein